MSVNFGDTQFYVLIVTLGNKIVSVMSPLHVACVSMVRARAQAPHDRVVPDLVACNGIGVCVCLPHSEDDHACVFVVVVVSNASSVRARAQCTPWYLTS